MNSEQSVLIVGAGPCGLAMACELSKFGIGVRILDAAPERMTGSRAVMLWPPALEVLDSIGVLEQVKARALLPRAYAYHIGTGTPSKVPFQPDLAPLTLPQDVTNGLLEEELVRLGCQVERGVQVAGVVPAADTVTVRAVRDDGTELTIEVGWLIAADGVHSAVRKQLGIDFDGQQYQQLFLLAEAQLDGELDRDAVHITVREHGALLAPLPGGEVRISTAVTEDTPLTAETVQRVLDERGPGGGLRVSSLSTLTTFVSHERLAGSIRAGRCFLVGDAAHVTSVFGGQGLSLGLQDVHNLAWKLAGVIDGRLEPSVLDSYDTERRAAAQQVIKFTRRMIRQADLGPMARRGRDALLRLLCATGVMERVQIPMLAGRRIHYPGVLGGGRAPTWVPSPAPATFGRFRLITTGPHTGAAAIEAARLAQTRSGIVVHETVDRPGKEIFLLIRPDGFVARTGPAAALPRAAALLDRLTTPQQQPALLATRTTN